jgi:hypothetical protein
MKFLMASVTFKERRKERKKKKSLVNDNSSYKHHHAPLYQEKDATTITMTRWKGFLATERRRMHY